MRILWKRALRHIPILLLLLIAPIIAVQVSDTEAFPAAAFYMPEQDAISQRVEHYLMENGFTRSDDPEEMIRQVQIGALGCCVVFPEGFANHVTEGRMDGSIRFYKAPSSYIPDLFQSYVAAAVFKEAVPYISASAFEGTEVSEEAVLALYEEMFAQGQAFSFAIETVSGTAIPENPKARTLAMNTAATLLCTVLFALCAELMENSFREMLGRLGLWQSVKAVLLPEALCNALLMALFAGAGLALAGFWELVLPGCVYAVLLTGVGLFLTAILPQAKQLYALLPVLVIATVSLCPGFTDLALVVPAVRGIRWVLPTYWFWAVAEKPLLWLLPTVGAVLAVPLSLLFRFGLIGKFYITNKAR